jgi:hypothetical protein
MTDRAAGNGSNHAPTRKPGRPPGFLQDRREFLQGFSPALRNHCSEEDRDSVLRAMEVLRNNRRFRWLLPDRENVMSAEEDSRFTILAELGRIKSAVSLRAVAARICQLQPPARRAIALIRHWRTGKAKPKSLASELIRTINEYLAQHPGAKWESISAAVQLAHDVVKDQWQQENKKSGH